MVVHRDRQHFFGVILPDDILVQPRLDLRRRQDMDILQRIEGTPGPGRGGAALGCGTRRRRGALIPVQRIVAHVDALVADVDTGAEDQLIHLFLGPAAEIADQFTFLSVLAGNRICHFLPPWFSVW